MPFIKSGYRGEMFVAISRLLYIAAEAFIVECVCVISVNIRDE